MSAAGCAGSGAGDAAAGAVAALGQGGGGSRTLVPVREMMEAELAEGRLPGAVWLVAQGDDVVVDTAGVTAVDGSTPMARDTIFRIASMTKAITAIAVLTLVEEGKLTLDAPIANWLPELANRRALARLDGPIDETVPTSRPITVRDVMTFTFGFGLLFDTSLPIQKAIDELELVNGQPVPMTPHGPDRAECLRTKSVRITLSGESMEVASKKRPLSGALLARTLCIATLHFVSETRCYMA